MIVVAFKSGTEDGVDDVDDPIEAFEVLAASSLGNWRAYSSHNVRAAGQHTLNNEQGAVCNTRILNC